VAPPHPLAATDPCPLLAAPTGRLPQPYTWLSDASTATLDHRAPGPI